MTPTLPDVLAGLLAEGAEGVYIALPATVETYDAATQTVSAQPSVRRGYVREDTTRGLERMPPVKHCPVAFMSGGGMRVTLPLARGDHGILLFTSCSLDRWFARGADVDPEDDRRSTLTDAFFIPGGRPRPDALAVAPADTMSIGCDDGPTIEISSTTIDAGGTDELAKKSDLDALRSALGTAVIGLGAGGAATVVTAADVITAPNPWPVGTSILRAG